MHTEHLPFQLFECKAVTFLVLSKGSSYGPACIDGEIEGADGEQESFLNLGCEGFTGVEEFVQGWGRVYDFEIRGATSDLLRIYIG